MAGYQVVAQGNSLNNLTALVEDMELTKGAKVRVTLELSVPYGWIFNIAGAEAAFQPYIPSGMDLIDVSGEGSQAYIDMEADPAFLLPLLTSLSFWIGIAIAGIAIGLIISYITVSVKSPVAAAIASIPMWLIIGAAAGAVGLIWIASKKGVMRASYQYGK